MLRISRGLLFVLGFLIAFVFAKELAHVMITGYHDPHNRYDPIVGGTLAGYPNAGPGDYITITNVSQGCDTAVWDSNNGQWQDASGSNGGGPGCGEHPDAHCPGSQ